MRAYINRDKLVVQSVMGEIAHPTSSTPFRMDENGFSRVLPATGGITYNVQVGDSVFGMAGDHVEPGVTVKNEDSGKNSALNLLACVGNVAQVISGDAKGARGYVTGKHGGVEHVLVYFDKATLDKLCIGDKIQIRAVGQGMDVQGFEKRAYAMNLDPVLFEKLNITVEDDVLNVPVAAIVPAHLMGSGLGSVSAYRGDYDIMTADEGELAVNNLAGLRYGDIVMLRDCDTSYGRGYLKGAATIGVVVHSDCVKMGHGPGVTTLLTAKLPIIKPILTLSANIADYLELQ